MPPKISGSASGSSTVRMICALGQAHAARGVDGVAVDLAHADVGVGEDRRDRQQRQRERHVRELRAPREGDEDAISATLGTARPTFDDADGEELSPGRCGRARARAGSAIAHRDEPIATRATASGAPTAAAGCGCRRLGAAALVLARCEDEARSRRRTRPGRRSVGVMRAARVHGVMQPLDAEHEQVEHDGQQRRTARRRRRRWT